MARIRTFAMGLDAYKTDNKQYPPPPNGPTLTALIDPIYVKADGQLGKDRLFVDEWERPLRYECWQEDSTSPGCDHYAIASAGADGIFAAGPLREVKQGTFDDPNEDIVLIDGNLVRYPSHVRGQ